MMPRIEDSLREMFAARTAAPPPVGDPAGRAIRRGRVLRRRRAAGSAATTATALLLVVGGVASLGGWKPAEETRFGTVLGYDVGRARPTATAAPVSSPAGDNGIGLDLRVGDRLWTTDGRQLRLTGVGEVTRTYRVPDGWVYAGAQSVRFLRTDGTSVSLSGRDDRWVLSPDGARIAFVIDTLLHIAQVRPTGLAVRASIPVPAAVEPVTFLGERVVVRAGTAGYGTLSHEESVEPLPDPGATTVLGARGDTVAALIRQAGTTVNCLAELRTGPFGLTVTRSGGCHAVTAQAGAAGSDTAAGSDSAALRWLAPGGGWIAEPRAGELALRQWDRAIIGQEETVSCPLRASVAPVWVDARTVLTADARSLVRCGTDGSREPVPLPDGVGEGWQLVPRLVAPATGTG